MIVLIRFAFRIGNHFGFSNGADEELQGYDANFGAYERYPFRVIRLPYNVLTARFGVCQDCMYLSGETRCNLTSASSWAPECLLLGVPIEPEDVDLLCVHFQPTSEHNDGAHELTSTICGKDA